MMVQIVQVREVEGVKVEGLVEKRIVRRAQEAMKPLFWGLLVYFGIDDDDALGRGGGEWGLT